MSDTKILWRAMDDSHLVWRHWEEDAERTEAEPLSVVYCVDSDETHLLNDLGVFILRALQERPHSAEELHEKLVQTFFSGAKDGISLRTIDDFLRNFKTTGLVEDF